ncbi:MAG: hypothetical protein HY352_04120 [Candidatus Omnitrophica bacterium]|nr:hypothetical protein [Candidatus Omnitrophota bacterium]
MMVHAIARVLFGLSTVGLLLSLPGEPMGPMLERSRVLRSIDDGIVRLSESEWRLSRAGMIARMTRDFVPIISLAETALTPLYEGDRLVGYRVGKQMERCAFYRDLGLRGGDLIQSVNGEPLQSLYEMYLKFRWLAQADVAIERRGRPLTFRYWID